MLEFVNLPLPANLVLFAVAAVVVLFAGDRLSRYADTISGITGIGHATMGLMLLAGVTSLPEIAVTVTATLDGHSILALNNLFGSIAMQVALLAAVDFTVGRRPLTAVVPEPAVMLEGSLNILLLAIVACGMVVGDMLFLGAGLWAWACLLGYVVSAWILSSEEGRVPWVVARRGEPEHSLIDEVESYRDPRGREAPLQPVIYKTALVAAAIVIAGFVVARSGEAIAEQTGLGENFIGFVLVAISTSLPEASTALAAARHGHFIMAVSDILGTNLLNVGLVFLIDILSAGQPVLTAAGTFPTFGALLAIVLLALFLAGLTERVEKQVFRLGYNSIAVLAIYCGGLMLLFQLR
ncbi:sodium:calcium antiporter [Chelativorans sp. YIM 93263]|uniref:sodium:calcium antiporter n=1 Tax=Chelativorans sp. YIM 93263 TaxID=2906648 RepID=UPI0023785A50|nr:sodium:calcium antiporter [Chelativorans sp. YIM 93263]